MKMVSVSRAPITSAIASPAISVTVTPDSSTASLLITDLGPAIRRFMQHQLMQPQTGAIAVLIRCLQDIECGFRQIFDGWDAVDDNGFMARNAVQELQHLAVLFIYQEGVIPDIDQMLLGQCLDVGKIHDHAVVGAALLADHCAKQGDFERIAMTVQVAALALVVGNPVAGVEFEFAGNGQHGGLYIKICTYGIRNNLWVCKLNFHFGLFLQVSIASCVLRSRSGPSIGCTKKLSKAR